jgi:hypothetical protein
MLSHFDIVRFKELGDLQTKKECFCFAKTA